MRGDGTGFAKIGGLLQRGEPVVGTDRAAPRLDPSRHAVAAHVLAQRRECLGVRLERDDPAGAQRGQVDAVRADVRADVDHEIAGCEPAPHILEHPELVERPQAFALRERVAPALGADEDELPLGVAEPHLGPAFGGRLGRHDHVVRLMPSVRSRSWTPNSRA